MTGDRFVDFLSPLSVTAGQGTITFVLDDAPADRSAGDFALAPTHALLWLPAYSLSTTSPSKLSVVETFG